MTRAALPFSVAAATLWFGSTARADTVANVGADPAASATFNGAVADGGSISTLIVNPALLVLTDEQVHLGLLVARPRATVRLLPRPRGLDVSRSIFDSSVSTAPGSEDRAVPTSELRTPRSDTSVTGSDTRLAIGFISSFGLRRVRLGALAIVPAGSSDAANVRTHYDDEREAAFTNRLHFMRFGESERVASVSAAIGVQPLDWLSIGAGVRLAATAVARLAVYVPDAAVQEKTHSNLETGVATSWRPILGATARFGKLSFGAVFRAESAFRVDAESEVTLWNDHDGGGQPRRTRMVMPMVFGWTPAELGVGVAYSGLRASATFERWSTYVDHHAEAHPEFRDVVSFALSATVPMTSALSTTLGTTYRPTPVPAQVGRTSFVDASVVGFALGERYHLKALGRTFVLAVTTQLLHMLPRTTHKDPALTIDAYPDDARTLRGGDPIPEARGLQTSSPGFPGYRAEGWLLSTSISLAYLL